MNICRRFRSSPWSLAFATAMRICLIVSLWQAPVPWLHRHGTTASKITSAAAACELSNHLAAFHADCAWKLDEDFGWHCHWILPSWMSGIEKSSDGRRPIEELCSIDLVSVCPIQSAASDSLSICTLCHHSLRPTRGTVVPPREMTRPSFEAAPRAMFCILRC